MYGIQNVRSYLKIVLYSIDMTHPLECNTFFFAAIEHSIQLQLICCLTWHLSLNSYQLFHLIESFSTFSFIDRITH